jgi:two-component sensor histidine kinase
LSPRPIAGASGSAGRTQVSADLTIIVPPDVTKHLLYRAQYVYSLQGRPKITGFLIDMTEKRRAEDQLALVAAELRHRVKNSFTVVQALARQTFAHGTDPQAALQTYLGRLQALSVANELVLNAETGEADVRDIVERITAPYREGRARAFELNGPSLGLVGTAVTGLSMVLHELCTNALKYGALSNGEGQVLLSWAKAADRGIALEWTEQGGPQASPPEREGFGTRLLTRMVRDSLSGHIDCQYRPSGFACRIRTGNIRSE